MNSEFSNSIYVQKCSCVNTCNYGEWLLLWIGSQGEYLKQFSYVIARFDVPSSARVLVLHVASYDKALEFYTNHVKNS